MCREGCSDLASPLIEVAIALVEWAVVDVAAFSCERRLCKRVAGGVVVEEQVLCVISVH